MNKAKKIQFPIEDYSEVEYDIENVDSINKSVYLVGMRMFLKDNQDNYYIRHGVHLVPIDKIIVENVIADFNKYFNNKFPKEQGNNILNRRLEELNNHIKKYTFD